MFSANVKVKHKESVFSKTRISFESYRIKTQNQNPKYFWGLQYPPR